MLDMSKRLIRPTVTLEKSEVLKGKRIHFDSVAEMLTVRAQEIPDTVYVYYYDQVITYGQTNERANRVANFLKSKEVTKGDFVSVMVLNSPECYYTMFGAQKLGAVAGAVNYMLKGPEIAYVLDDCKPKVVFVDSEFMVEFTRGYETAKHKPIVVEVETGIDHGSKIAVDTLANILKTNPAEEALVPQNLEDPFLLLYSSGTTGKPKGVLLPNRSQISMNRAVTKMNVIQPKDIMMIVLPMFHSNPICTFTYPLAYMGVSICIRKKFAPDDFWPSIIKYGITVTFGVPAMFAYVLNKFHPNDMNLSQIKLRVALTGSAPVPVELVRSFKDSFGVTITNGFGLTEVAGTCTQSFNLPDNWASAGIVIPEQELVIMDENNNILPYSEHGEICLRGEAVMLGYLNQLEATAETIVDGWLHTGDRGYLDEQGYLYFTGRIKEMINRGGENIYPREIEVPLEAHPKIIEVAVIGAPNPELGERVMACIRLNEPGTMTAKEVRDYLADKIAKYKIPELVEFVDDFPRNPTGKILKLELKKQLT